MKKLLSIVLVFAFVNATAQEKKEADKEENMWSVYPVPVKRGNDLIVTGEGGKAYTIHVISKEGKILRQINTQGSYRLQTGNLPAGIYYLKMLVNNQQTVKRIMVVD